MGVIQSLRSQATAVRAQEDTKLQVSGYLSTVNKNLGGQISQLIEGLQNAINERTKAYNATTYKLTQTIQGKGGIGEQGIQFTFSLAKVLIGITNLAKMQFANSKNDGNQSGTPKEAQDEKTHGATEQSIVKNYTVIYDSISYPLYKSLSDILYNSLKSAGPTQSAADKASETKQSADLVSMVGALFSLMDTVVKGVSLNLLIQNIRFDYERMTTQLGLTELLPSDLNLAGVVTNMDQGASKLLNMRDSLMLRYKIHDSSPALPTTKFANKGYIGSLRRRI